MSFNSNLRFTLAAALLVSSMCSLAHAQADTGSLRVLVTDASEAPVPSATVKVVNAATNLTSTRATSNDVYAVFSPITRGSYNIEVSQTGFQTARANSVLLEVDERKLVRIPLQLAAVSGSIQVSADAVTIQSEQGSLGQVIQGNVAVELPLAARRYSELALLAPGVTNSTFNVTTRGPGWFVSNGNYPIQNNFIIDGVDNNQGTTNAQSLSAQVVQPSPDAISEFKVQTNSYSAEFGRSAGAVVNVSIKSGTNSVHGAAWYYNRDSALAATPWSANLIGASKPDLKWNQFGGALGGPIKKNKLFYFLDYEGFLQRFANQFLTTVPTLDERQGKFYQTIKDPATNQPFSNNAIPQSQWDALGAKLVAAFPEPNLPGRVVKGGQTVENYGVSRPGSENTQKGDIRGDYNLSEADQLSMRYSYLRQDIFRNGIFPGIADGVGNQGAQFNLNHSSGFTWTRIVSPSMVNSFRVGYNRTFATFAHASNNGPTGTDFGFKGLPPTPTRIGGLPLININNYNSLGVRNYRPQFQEPELIQFLDSVSLIRGAHSIRAGFETRFKNNSFLDSTRTEPAYSFQGRYTGEALADLFLGLPQSVDANTQAIVEQVQHAIAGFVQDDWKVTPNLTVNLGLRYEYTTPYYGVGKNRNINFDFKTGTLVRATDKDRYLVHPDYSNVAPRLGLAWQVAPRKVVLRAGYGIFYSGEDMSGSDINLALNPPQLIPVTLSRVGNGPAPVKLSDPLPANLFDTYNTSKVSVRAREKDYHAAKIQQFNVATEFTLPLDSTFEIAYVGNRGSNLLAQYDANQTPFGVAGSVAANRPYAQWAQVHVGATRAKSWYNALQLKYDKRFTRGWYALGSYTWASALDEAGAWGENNSPQYLDDFRHERGPQTQTPRQRFTLANVFDLPIGKDRWLGRRMNRVANAIVGGWQVSNIITLRSGLPVNVGLAGSGTDPATGQHYSFFDRNGGGLRPNRVGNPNTGIDPKHDRFNFLNVNAFQVQPVNTPGNASRNVALGPHFYNVDLSLVKRFAVSESVAVDLRVDAFNLLNQVNFTNPNSTFGSSSFGSITGAYDPRVLQMAIRLRF